MRRLCGATCKRKTGQPCRTCRSAGAVRIVQLDDRGKPIHPRNGQLRHATPHEKGAAVDMRFDGVSYRKTAQNMKRYFGRETNPPTICRWVRELTAKADSPLKPVEVRAGDVRVADEVAINVGEQNCRLFNAMDSDSRFLLAAHLSPERTTRAAATALALARERAANLPSKCNTTVGIETPRRCVDYAVGRGLVWMRRSPPLCCAIRTWYSRTLSSGCNPLDVSPCRRIWGIRRCGALRWRTARRACRRRTG